MNTKFAVVKMLSLLLLLWMGATRAEDCSRSLVPDVSTIKNDVAARSSFLSIVNKENYNSMKTNAGLSAELQALEIPFGIDASYDQFSEGRSKHYEKVKYSSDYKNASGFLLRKISPESFAAYTDCLRLQAQLTDGPHIVPVAVSPTLLTAKIIWRAPPGVSKGSATYDSEGIEPESIKKLPKTLLSSSESDFIFRLRPNSEARLAIRIGGKADSLVIPLPPMVTAAPTVSGPKEVYLRDYTTDGADGRRGKHHTCPSGYHVIPDSGICSSTDPAQSGKLVANTQVGSMSWACQWENYSGIGVGLEIRMACTKD